MLKNNIGGLFLFIFCVGLVPRMVWGASEPVALLPASLAVQVSENGTIVVSDDLRSIAAIRPVVFTEGWNNYYFDMKGDLAGAGDPQGVAVLGFGQVVDVHAKVETVEGEIHVHYQLVPRDDVRVIQVCASASMPYADWQGQAYQLNDKLGVVPIPLVEKTQIDEMLSPHFQMKASNNPEKLQFALQADNLSFRLQDDRKWSPFMTSVLTHGEDSAKPWVWKKGEEKVFDFTVSFGRSLSPFPAVSPNRSKNIDGHWCGTIQDDQGRVRGRLSAKLFIDPSGKIKAFFNYDSPDWSLFSGIPVEFNGSEKAYVVQYADGGPQLNLKWDKKKDGLQGTFAVWGKTYGVRLEKGFAFEVPRTEGDSHDAYQLPLEMKDGWERGNLTEAGFDPRTVQKGIDKVLDGTFANVHSLSIVRHGKLVLDEYFYGYKPQDLHPLCSATKGVFSSVFGIAEANGIWNTDQKLFDFFPDFEKQKGFDPRKKTITLGMLLRMNSGLDCDDYGIDCELNMIKSPDWLAYCLNLPVAHSPGQHFMYSGTCLTPLGVLLSRQTGMSVFEFAQKNLFQPLGIQEAFWEEGPNHISEMGTGLWLRPRDMAKLGELYLRKGSWNGQRVISDKWVSRATSSQALDEKPKDFNYGYLWWERTLNVHGRSIPFFYAAGYGGQYIFIVPELDLVCVITAGNYTDWSADNNEYGLFKEYVASAIN